MRKNEGRSFEVEAEFEHGRAVKVQQFNNMRRQRGVVVAG